MSTGGLRAYVSAWNANDTEKIVDAVTDDVVVIESHGPIYRGSPRVRQWAETWFARGGRVHRWDITDLVEIEDRVIAQWRFSHHWDGAERVLEGCTFARVHDGLVVYLREYATIQPLYEWEGEWR